MRTKILVVIFYLFLIGLIFRNVFFGGVISGGDYIIFWPENIAYLRDFSFFSWDSTVGLGYNSLGVLHYAPYNFLIGWLGILISDQTFWWERIGWWIPFFIFSFFSIVTLYKKVLPKNLFWPLSPLIFVFNTYVFMILGGGQIAGIGLAYAIAPTVLASFIMLINYFQTLQQEFKVQNSKPGTILYLAKFKITVKNLKLLRLSLLYGLLIAAQVMLDLRIAYVTIIAAILYLVLSIKYQVSKRNILNTLYLILYTLIIPLGITGLLHAFWIIPTILFRVNTIEQLGSAYNSLSAVNFFSFATFENSLSLLHPNWPENIFGKVGFMRAEFLLLPILAYASLLFINAKRKTQNVKQQFKNQNIESHLDIEPFNHRIILFFALLALVGAFLAKGANEPFGQIYLWMFGHVPGFIMFRDPTKFYLLIALAYSILIPFVISKIYNKFSIFNFQFSIKSKIFNLQNAFLLFAICYLLFAIRPAFSNQLGGTFQRHEIPKEYIQLKNFIASQPEFFRTLWIPQRQRFVFLSDTYPAVDASIIFNTSSSSGMLNLLNKRTYQQRLQESAVKYIIVPDDTKKELFLKNNRYNESLRQAFITQLDNLSYIKKSKIFGKIVVYEVIEPGDRFWTTSHTMRISSKRLSPASYKVKVTNAHKGDSLIFSEAFDQNWTIQGSGFRVQGSGFDDKFNSFILPKSGDYQLEVYFEPQKWLSRGLVVSATSLVLLITSLIILRRRLNKK